MDYDYTDRLPPEERTWLGQFTDRFYGADFRGPSSADWTDEARKAQYRIKNAANRDIYAHAEGHGPEGLEDHPTEETTVSNPSDPIEPKRRGRPRKYPPVVEEAGVGEGASAGVGEDGKALAGSVTRSGLSAVPAHDLAPVEWLALHKTPRGYVVLAAKSVGHEIVDEDVVHGPMPHASARNFLRLEVERRFLRRPR